MPVPAVGRHANTVRTRVVTNPLSQSRDAAPPVARLNAGAAAAYTRCRGATLNTCVSYDGGGYRFHWRYGRGATYRRFDRHVLLYRSGIGFAGFFMPPVVRVTGAFLPPLQNSKAGGSGLVSSVSGSGSVGNRLFDNRRR